MIELNENGDIEVPPIVKYLGQPEWVDVCSNIKKNNKIDMSYCLKEIEIKQKFKGVKARLKILKARNAMLKLHLLDFLNVRDRIIKCKNKIIIDKKIYRHDLDLRDINNLILVYESQIGSKRFPTLSAYNYYIKTGRKPYEIINT